MNNVLLAAIIAVNLYLIVLPFVPALLFKADHNGSQSSKALTQKIAQGLTAPKKAAAAPPANQLIIPSMQYDEPIIEGKTITALRYGPWHIPTGSSPDKGGNTVIAGHRFTYTNPRGTFYYLNKVQVGDEIGVIWQGKTYEYKVTTTEVVPPTDMAVENQTASPTLTLFTCTPLWLPKDRLVVVASLEQTS
ncbi:MAG TPA: class E sortase [Candidatus Saccharimonadales bacterium]